MLSATASETRVLNLFLLFLTSEVCSLYQRLIFVDVIYSCLDENIAWWQVSPRIKKATSVLP